MQREQLLRARDARQALIDRACAGHEPRRPARGGAVVFASTAIPGSEKNPEGLERIFAGACERLGSRLEATVLERGLDALGPWALFRTSRPSADAKRAAVEVESHHPAGRLLDLDVYDGGLQVDRASLDMPPRACLVCEEPAVECIRLKRHHAEELARAVEQLLGLRKAANRAAERLAACLVTGARVELALTPKPGLVDRDDSGSHPDLSFEQMTRSVDLLPQYFEELIAAPGPRPLEACVAAGRRAERRMLDAVGSNAHRGYIFLGGLALLGALDGADQIREGIRRAAGAVAAARRAAPAAPASHGALVRERHTLGGIEREALDGLPSVFEHGLPALRARRAALDYRRGADTDEPLHYTMAVLMQVVEDTTAVYRCGPPGLARLREDGRHLQISIDQGRPYLPWLRDLNLAYRRLNLTMGGVADCLALTVALDRWLP
jgi:holo-ACP synthase CitX